MTQPFARPKTLDDALRLMAEGGWQPLAGGTDVYPGLRDRPLRRPLLDITAIDALRGIRRDDAGWRIGACATWTDIVRADLPPAFRALQQAAREVGGVQVQNAGTVAGNLCNASPAADGVPALLILDAEVELACAGGRRRVPLAGFVTGNRRTVRRPDELVTAIVVPALAAAGVGSFRKLGARRYLVISIAMAAVRLEVDADGLVTAAVAVGACSEVAQRMPAVEAALAGQTADAGLADRVDPGQLGTLAPLDDVRASAGYRRAAAAELVRRAVDDCVRA